MKTTSAEHGQKMFCPYFHGISMNNQLSYCGLIDGKIRASVNDLPVPNKLDCYLRINVPILDKTRQSFYLATQFTLI